MSPFNVLSSAQTASPANDFIVLFGSATDSAGGITLEASQTLLGETGMLLGPRLGHGEDQVRWPHPR
jgi:hypothetical protein